MTQTDKMPAETKRRLAVWRRRLASFRYGTAWRVLVKTAAACLLTALLIFVYAQEIAKWWGAPFLIVGAAAICAIPVICARCRREIARLEQECARLEKKRRSRPAFSPPPPAQRAAHFRGTEIR